MQNFNLETIFTAISGINFTDDFDNVYRLAWFVYDNPRINKCGLVSLKDQLKQHLLTIHPELENIGYIPILEKNYTKWMSLQKLKFGETLPVSKFGCKLEETETMTKKMN